MAEKIDVKARLASVLGRRDEVPNIELAEDIAAKGDKNAIKELVDLTQQKNKDLQNDSIKTLYEVGARKPELVAGYTDVFVGLLSHKNNRLQWGGMEALNAIAGNDAEAIYGKLTTILDAAAKGSVITRDGAMKILAKLAGTSKHGNEALSLMLEQLLKSPTNQLPMYAELTEPVTPAARKDEVIQVLQTRMDDLEKDSQRKRLNKVIAKLGKKK